MLEFTRRFSMAHRLLEIGSTKCAMIHGHNEFVTITMENTNGRRVDWGHSNIAIQFADAKRKWHDWIDNVVDHALQLGHNDPLLQTFMKNEPERIHRIVVTPGDPTTEIMCLLLAYKCSVFLKGLDLTITKVELEETPTNKVTFHDPIGEFVIDRVQEKIDTLEDWVWLQGGYSRLPDWWARDDRTINNFDTPVH